MTTVAEDLPFITKLVSPGRRADLVRRSALLDAFRKALNRRVLVIWAPAGYGKTTALTELAAQVSFPVCWYTLGPEDKDPAVFLRYCFRGVELALGRIRSIESRLAAVTSQQDWRSLAGQLITSLHGQLQNRLLFVFDDVHHIEASEDVREALSILIDRAPAGVRFVLSGRTRPSLPCLPRLNLQDEVEVFDRETLRLSTDETAGLLFQIWKRPVEQHEAQCINERASGWTAGIILLAKAGGLVEPTGTVYTPSDSLFFDYLTQEVFRNLPGHYQRFLLHSSILGEFTAELCDKLLESPDSQQIISDLKEKGYFIEERPSIVPTYRYHDLFREYLQRSLIREHPAIYRGLHQRAALLAEEKGDDGAAISHWVAAGSPAKAAAVLKQTAEFYVQRGLWRTLEGWLSLLPAGVLEQDLQLLLVRAQVHLRLGQPSMALEYLDRIVSAAPQEESQIIGKVLIVKSFGSRLLGNLDSAVDLAKKGLALLGTNNAPVREVAEGYRQLASAQATRGEFSEAQKNFELALSLAPEQDLELRSLVYDGLAGVHADLGELDEAAAYLEKARQGWLKLGNEGSLAATLLNLAEVYYYRGEFDIAMDELQAAQRAASRAGYQRVLPTVRVAMGVIQGAQKHHKEALDNLLAGLQEARQILDVRLVAEATNALGNTYRRLGEPHKAEVLLRDALLEAQQSGQMYLSARYQVSLGKTYCQLGDFDEALKRLEAAEALLCEQGSLRGVAEAKLCQGVVLYRMGRTQDALLCMAKLGDQLRELGYLGFLVADGDEAIELLRLSVAKEIGMPQLVSLLRRLDGSPDADDGADQRTGRRTLPKLRVLGFGQSQVFLENHEVTDHEWRSRKAKELFFFLLCRKGATSKEELIEALWPEAEPGSCEDALRMNIHRMRRALYQGCVLAMSHGYCVDPHLLPEFDLYQFEEILNELGRSDEESENRYTKLRQVIDLYRGPFLVEFYSEWSQHLRTHLELKYQAALMDLARYHAARKQFSQAIQLVEKVVASDPYDEVAQLMLARAYLELRDPLTALRLMRDYMRTAREDLQTNPSAEYFELYNEALKKGPFIAATAG